MTLPMITSSIACASTPERCTAARIAVAPSSGAVSGARPPRNLPIGVRTAETMTGWRDDIDDIGNAERGLETRTWDLVSSQRKLKSPGAGWKFRPQTPCYGGYGMNVQMTMSGVI